MDAPALRRRPPARRTAPVLDAAQRRVVEHAGGPLLVLAGPGTGKTTTLVEAVVHRVEQRGLAPEQVLALTFSRTAAQELRERVTARLGRTTRGPVAMTLHGYAYALLRRELTGAPLRLLTGPEQDLEVARLLAGDLADGALRWPEELRGAVPLRGFRSELRDLLQRAQERGVAPEDLARLGVEAGRPEWEAAAGFLADYERRFDLDPFAETVDQAGLVQAAAGLLEQDAALRARERAARAVVLVDEVQDTDPAQWRLLQALAGDGRDLVAVGDPDQAIYAFRGADVRGLAGFRERFRTAAGAPAPLVALRTSRRSGPVLLAASRSVAARLPRLPGADHRDLAGEEATPGRVDVLLASSPSAEAALVADVLRRAHLHDGVPWSAMAVLLRSTPQSLAVLRRGLLAAGVPVGTPRDEVPLAEEPLVQALLHLLQTALGGGAGEQDVLDLLAGPLVRADALAVRRLRRALRRLDLEAGRATDAPALLVEAVLDPRSALLLPSAERGPLDRAHALLAAVRGAAGGTVEDVLWEAWQAAGLERRLVADSAAGGARGAAADRGLDAVIALFDAAARYVDRLPAAGPLGFLADVQAQEVPGDTLAARTPEGDAVRVMTAHASKGLEWRLVVVAGVQEGVWPDLRLRGSLLGADALADRVAGRGDGAARLSPDALAARRGELLAEERRLFYVAVTRARERLVVTAVASGEGGDDRPSRFLDELGVPVPPVAAPVGRPLTSAGLVAELRTVAASTPDPALREAACRRLAVLAGPGDGHVAAADPARWWGLAPLSDDGPLVREGEGVRVSPSKVESFDTCSLRWLLETAVGVSGTTGPSQVLGTLVHALAELGSGADALTEEQLTVRLDEVLPELDLGAPWAVVRRREEAVGALRRFLAWQAANDRELVATELEVAVPLGDGAELRGRVDRLERDAQGRAVVVDLKTGTGRPSRDELPRQPQLGVYQLAVALGAFADRGLHEPGGASLVQLKKGKQALEQHQVALSDDDDPAWAEQLVGDVVRGMSGGSFPAAVNKHCQSCAVHTSCPAWPEGDGVVR